MPKKLGQGPLSPLFRQCLKETIFLEDTFPYFFNYCCNRRLQSPSKNATFMFKTLEHFKKLQSWMAPLAVFGRKVRIVCNHIHLKISTAFPFRSPPSLELQLVSSLVSLLYLLLFISCFALQSASPSAPSSSSYLELGASSAAISRASAGRPTSQMRGCWVFKSSTDTFISLFLILLVLNLVSTF